MGQDQDPLCLSMKQSASALSSSCRGHPGNKIRQFPSPLFRRVSIVRDILQRLIRYQTWYQTKDLKVIKYLEDRIDIIELKSILKLNKISKDKILRTNETSYKELKLSKKDLSKDEIINYIVKFPILLQRPLVFKYQNNELVKAVIGRPAETVLNLFN